VRYGRFFWIGSKIFFLNPPATLCSRTKRQNSGVWLHPKGFPSRQSRKEPSRKPVEKYAVRLASLAKNAGKITTALAPASGAKYGYLTIRSRKSKNSKSRNVPLTNRVSGMLKERSGSKPTGLVFCRADGSGLVQTWVNEQHRDIRDLLKLPEECVPHSFRHTFGTRLGSIFSSKNEPELRSGRPVLGSFRF